MPNKDLSDDVLNATYIGLEYQQAKLSRLQFNNWVWFHILGAVAIILTAIVDPIPSYFGEGKFTLVVIAVWLIGGVVNMHMQYIRKRNEFIFSKQRLLLELDSEFMSDDPDLDSINPSDVRSEFYNRF